MVKYDLCLHRFWKKKLQKKIIISQIRKLKNQYDFVITTGGIGPTHDDITSESISKVFKVNDDLAESISLSHDLGHTPFGHAGEEALNECMKHFGGFDHNIQTLRIVTLLENKYYNFKGLNNLSLPLTIKTARETYATTLLRNGVSKDEIGEMLGHSNSIVTEH